MLICIHTIKRNANTISRQGNSFIANAVKLIKFASTMCIFIGFLIAISASGVCAHSQNPPSGTYRISLNETFSLTVFENFGFTCTAAVDVTSSDETLATIVSPSSYDVPADTPHVFKVKANSTTPGTVTISTHYVGIDKFNNNPSGPCQGENTYKVTLKISEDICAASPSSVSGAQASILALGSGAEPVFDDAGNEWKLNINNGTITGEVSSFHSANCIYDVKGTYSGSQFTMTVTYVGGDDNKDLCCANTSPAVISGTISNNDSLLVADGQKVGYNNGDCSTLHYALFPCNAIPGEITLCDTAANEWKISAQGGQITGYSRSFHSANCVYDVTGTYDANAFTMTPTYVGGDANKDMCCANTSPAVITGDPSSTPLSGTGGKIGYNNGDCSPVDYLFSSCTGSGEDFDYCLRDDTGNEWKLNVQNGNISGYLHSFYSANCIYDVKGTYSGANFTMTPTYVGGDENKDLCCANTSPAVISGTISNTITATGQRVGYNAGNCAPAPWDYTFTPCQ